jgi:hypothetical protein
MQVAAVDEQAQRLDPALAGLRAARCARVCRQGSVHGVDRGSRRRGRLVGQRGHGGRQSGAHPNHQRVDNGGHRCGVRASDVSVPDRSDQGGNRGHESGHVGVDRRFGVDEGEHLR